MAFSRSFLKSIGLNEEQITRTIEAHTDVVNGLKSERDTAKEKADKFDEVQKQLNDANAKIKEMGDSKKDYDNLKTEYDEYKSKVENEKTATAKNTAVTNALKKAGVVDKYIAKVLKVTDLQGIALDENGKLVDENKFIDSAKTEWAEFIGTSSQVGANTATPPAGTGNTTMTKDEIMNIKDPVKRQQAIAENLALFNK